MASADIPAHDHSLTDKMDIFSIGNFYLIADVQ
jgi:hypothetical protein